jgi:threonine/homoserine efflux transporter RhtA
MRNAQAYCIASVSTVLLCIVALSLPRLHELYSTASLIVAVVVSVVPACLDLIALSTHLNKAFSDFSSSL